MVVVFVMCDLSRIVLVVEVFIFGWMVSFVEVRVFLVSVFVLLELLLWGRICMSDFYYDVVVVGMEFIGFIIVVLLVKKGYCVLVFGYGY